MWAPKHETTYVCTRCYGGGRTRNRNGPAGGISRRRYRSRQSAQRRHRTPTHVIDVNRLPLTSVRLDGKALHIEAFARMSDVAASPVVRQNIPALSESLEKSASAQIRNMATMGGNLMQRTRYAYFRADRTLPCNKRTPGSGCSALLASTRGHAIFGGSASCVATNPSDLAVTLSAFDAIVHVRSTQGARAIRIANFHKLPDERPDLDTSLRHAKERPLQRTTNVAVSKIGLTFASACVTQGRCPKVTQDLIVERGLSSR